MTFEERVAAVEAFGFTPRQARFLVTVMLHAGVCLLRHYCAWSRIVYGQKARDFFRAARGRRLCHDLRLRPRRARGSTTSSTRRSMPRSASPTAGIGSRWRCRGRSSG